MSNELTLSTSERETPSSKKRDASSPLQDSVDTYKKHKQQGDCDSSLISISESQLDTDTDISDLSDSERAVQPKFDTPSPDMASSASKSKLSDDDIDRIALRVRAIMVPEMKSMIDAGIRELRNEYDSKIVDMRKSIDELKDENNELRSDLNMMKNEVFKLKSRDDELEQYSRRNSLRISGISESDQRPTDDIVLSIASEYNIAITSQDLDRSHRVGRVNDNSSRAILVKFSSYNAKRAFMMKKKDLKAGLYFNEDLTKMRSELLFRARRLFKAERLFGAWCFGGNIYVRDTKNEKHEVKSVIEIERLASVEPVKRPRRASRELSQMEA